MEPQETRADGPVYIAVRTVGELLITAGVIVLLFVVYTLYVTDIVAAQKQDAAGQELEKIWSGQPADEPATGEDTPQPATRPKPAEGKPFLRLGIPRFGPDFRFVVVEGVGQPELAIGPGHYPTTALPGEPGNVGIAGHRIGKGAPFNDLDKLAACDPIVLETAGDFFVYRVMPMAEQIDDWETIKADDPRCAKVPTLRTDEEGGGPYGETVGRRIVTPDRGDAVAAVPYQPNDPLAKAQQAALLTLTTCHPEFGNSERMIIHAVLTNQEPKSRVRDYDALLSLMGER